MFPVDGDNKASVMIWDSLGDDSDHSKCYYALFSCLLFVCTFCGISQNFFHIRYCYYSERISLGCIWQLHFCLELKHIYYCFILFVVDVDLATFTFGNAIWFKTFVSFCHCWLYYVSCVML